MISSPFTYELDTLKLLLQHIEQMFSIAILIRAIFSLGTIDRSNFVTFMGYIRNYGTTVDCLALENARSSMDPFRDEKQIITSFASRQFSEIDSRLVTYVNH